jgi:hypothetical protein
MVGVESVENRGQGRKSRQRSRGRVKVKDHPVLKSVKGREGVGEKWRSFGYKDRIIYNGSCCPPDGNDPPNLEVASKGMDEHLRTRNRLTTPSLYPISTLGRILVHDD